MAGTFMTAGAPQHAQDSLPALPAHLQSDTHLTAHLASRFHVHLPTARLSSHGIISVNTYTSSAKGPHGGKEGSAMAAAEELAARAFSRLGSRSENQAVVFLGESGSGKTTLRSHFLSSVLALSATPLSSKLSYAAFVFDTLTTTKTITTPTASKAGLFYELQYDTAASSRPLLVGGKLLDHRLERSRIASVPTGERSFHALYYLLAGTSSAEKSHLGLDSTPITNDNRNSSSGNKFSAGQKRWRYLGHPTQLKVGINDAEGFQQFKTALRKLEFPRSEIAEICQVLASILHLGQLEFMSTQSTTPAADDSGGYSHEGGEDVTAVKNKDVLGIIAAFLGINTQDLETALGYKSKTLYRERVTVMLDPKGARENADELARCLYSLLVAYVVESINSKVCAFDDAVSNTISVVDFPGFSQTSATGFTLEQLLNNTATEAIYHFCLQSFFERKVQLLDSEDVEVPPTSYFDNSDAVKGLTKSGNGLLAILDDQMRRGKSDHQFLEALRKRFENKNPAIEVGSTTAVLPGSNFATKNENASFVVRHFAGEVEYPVEGLLEDNGEIVSGDFMNLLSATKSDFVKALFGQEALQTIYHPSDKSAIVQATLSSKPARRPSMARSKADRSSRPAMARKFSVATSDAPPDTGVSRKQSKGRKGKTENLATQGAAAEFLSSLEDITTSLSAPDVNPYFVFCLKPNDRRIANQFDSKCVRSQIQTFGIAEMSQRLRNADFSIFLPFGEFLGLAEMDPLYIGSDVEKCETILNDKNWPMNEARVGTTGVLLSERCWRLISNIPSDGVMIPSMPVSRAGDGGDDNIAPFGGPNLGVNNESKVRLLSSESPGYSDDKAGGYLDSKEDTRSEAGASALGQGDMFRNMEGRAELAEKGNEKNMEEVDSVVVSPSRKRWLFLIYLLTFWVPGFAIRWIGGIKRKDVRMAWREKFAINLMIWLSCALVIFIIIGLPQLICPTQLVYSEAELSSFNGQNGETSYVAIRGVVFDLDAFVTSHYPNLIPHSTITKKYAGQDVTNLFPVQVSALCQGINGPINDAVQVSPQSNNYTGQSVFTDTNYRYHDFRHATTLYDPTWFTEQMLNLEKFYFKGHVGYPPKYLQTLASQNNNFASIHGKVYDFTTYINGGVPPLFPLGENSTLPPSDSQFMASSIVNLFADHPGQDVSAYWDQLNLDPTDRANQLVCMNNLFYVGNVDTRGSAQCLFARYFLLAISILLASVIGFKFFAALQFGGKNIPEDLDKFLICTIPAYTEDEDSLRRAIDSAARMKYDDKRKLLVIICDGMIIGQGNDRPTPRIVLDILGVGETVDPEPLSFESLGEGMKQHNMGKVYSGLYEVQGHIVPFMVIVKVGKPSEVQRPGNRGKRDSQMVIMRFLNRVHYNLPMTPMELEMHHQIRNIIGVNPTFYEFLLQIDADTVVAPDSATRMISSFLHDTRLIGVCGETALSNAKSSIVTMMQVYEYYISHNLTKAFESLFGSVTCLPGCFTMYRIRAAETGKPLFVSKDLIEAYSEIRVDTLHMKNLLHLGEDRYLTTLLLKLHSSYKTKYIFRAHAWTIAPDSWKVFLSQRRRWINSTVHNIIELIPLQQLCGFCCFSMRFIVFLDLMSTIVQPVIVGYIVYLIVRVVQDPDVVPITAFILLGAIYGLQAIIFILRRKWEMIGWMLIYLLATPVFACALPLYAFWHMDDFSWGNTRVVTGEKGRQIVVSDEGKFDPRTIPRKRWEDYQAELWEAQTQRDMDDDARSQVSGFSYASKSAYGIAGSAYNMQTAPPMPQMMPTGYNTRGPTPLQSSRVSTAYPMGTTPQPPAQMIRTNSRGPTPLQSSRVSQAYPIGTSPQPPVQNTGLAGMEMSEMGSGAMMHGADQPSDDTLLAEIRDILSKADLMSVSKRSVKQELERRFGISMDSRKYFISSATEAVLAGNL